jgi:pyruvate/2-oxoglutarate dehydrogenase complex dihydrolipoamide dehydrogenase (E3) component
MERRDLVILGGGAGGLVVASVASQLGLKVTLIEKQPKLGGDCLHYGCVPSKTLIHAARVAHLQRRAADYGLTPSDATVDLGRVNDRVQDVIAHIQKHDDPERFRSYGCEVDFGEASFTDPHSVEIAGRRIFAKRFVIATGSRPFVPPIPGLPEAGFLTNESVFSLKTLPKRLAVLGGGPIGLELAQAFARLGSAVTVIERLPRLLPAEDGEVAGRLRELLAAEGLTIHTDTTAERVERDGEMKVVHCNGGRRVEADALLVAVGRRPNVERLKLEAIGVAYDQRGIKVDGRQRTTLKNVYACGDVCGPYPFTHMAEYQAGIVIANAVFRFPKKADYRVVPWATFTDPELARAGLTEEQARAQGIEPEILRFPFESVDRALCEREPRGLVKLVAHKGRVLGATVLGPHAGEYIHEIALVMRRSGRLRELTDTIHVYPTLAQSLRRAANTYYSGALFSPRTRAMVKWLNRLLP